MMTAEKFRIASLLTAMLGLLSLADVVQAQLNPPTVCYARAIWTGSERIEDAAMLIEAGRVRQVGPRTEMKGPAGARILDVGDSLIIRGRVSAQSTLGGTQPEEETLTPQLLALDGFDFFTERPELLEAGLTSAVISPSPSNTTSPEVT